jgi:hypothetical protein
MPVLPKAVRRRAADTADVTDALPAGSNRLEQSLIRLRSRTLIRPSHSWQSSRLLGLLNCEMSSRDYPCGRMKQPSRAH